MANKRQRKKQQTKQNIHKLEQLQIDKKRIKRIRNDTKTVQQIVFKETRKQTAARRSAEIKALGYKVKDHSSKRYWSDVRYNEWYADELRKKARRDKLLEKKQRDDQDNYLLIFWRDKTAEGYADEDLIERYKYVYKYMDSETLLQNINFYLRTEKPMGAEIGTTLCVVVRGSQRKQYIDFMTHYSQVSSMMSDSNDWILVYEGKAKRYKDLLLAVHAVIRLLYDTSERASFINALVGKHLPQINPSMAKRFAKDIGWSDF